MKVFLDDKEFEKIADKQLPYLEDFMLNKINTNFSIAANKPLLKSNEEMYDSYFASIIGDFNKNKFDINYYSKLFGDICDHSDNNWLIYTKLI